MKKIVLHTCCGPCASGCVPRLKADDLDIVLYFANSNLDTREEYERRLASARKLAEAEGCEIAAEPYDHEEWLKEVAVGYEDAPEKGARCARCFKYNLEKAAAFAASRGISEYTTSLTVSPHKPSQVIFASAGVGFVPYDFKKQGGFLLSNRRAAELKLYRQNYCGCEFSKWRLMHKKETVSTNLDARGKVPRTVITADYQSAGRGRLDHKWLSPPGVNLMMSVVLSVRDLPPEQVATLPLIVGLSVAQAVGSRELKWPNDVLLDGKKVAGILCERDGDNVIAGIGVNVLQQDFPSEIAARATCLGGTWTVVGVRTEILRRLDRNFAVWREKGLEALLPELNERDFLKGKRIRIRQTDDDLSPVSGICTGILPDGSLSVDGVSIYAGEAHVEKF